MITTDSTGSQLPSNNVAARSALGVYHSQVSTRPATAPTANGSQGTPNRSGRRCSPTTSVFTIRITANNNGPDTNNSGVHLYNIPKPNTTPNSTEKAAERKVSVHSSKYTASVIIAVSA